MFSLRKCTNRILLILVFCPCIALTALAQSTNIPDPNFEQVLINLGLDSAPIDGQVNTASITNVGQLFIDSEGISDLTGIGDFQALTVLYCPYNSLGSLDLSSNVNLQFLTCSGNGLTSLIVSNNPALIQIDCSGNQLSTIDVSSCTNLELLNCGENSLTTLDLSSNLNLKNLICRDNQLSNLDVSNNPNLQTLLGGLNSFTDFPLGLESLTAMLSLKLEDCNLSGCWPSGFTTLCSSLITYNFNGNSYDGTSNFISDLGFTNFCNNNVGECSSCFSNLVLTADVLTGESLLFESDNFIECLNIVNQGATLQLDATDFIDLLPGFQAISGSDVEMVIEGCGGSFP